MRQLASLGRGFTVAVVLLGLHTAIANGSRTPGHDATLNAAPAAPEVCESKTINYITHTLPQQCLRTSWTAAPTAAATATPEATVTSAATTTSGGPEPTAMNETQQEQKQGEGFASGSFMSFEEWKEMMLRKSGQDPAKLKDRKGHEHRADRDPTMAGHEPDSIGEDGEIDFDALSEKVSELASSSSGEPTPHPGNEVEEPVLHEDGVAPYYRSKDAGKTCKERFSYSSFDAGATILKTSPGAKNPKAILVENKDTYMLLECRTKNKFVIVELSDDILVDTVVLANFEFFSSMIRQFRVSVSDRYPVKLEKWVDLGTFEARNTRDIQAFLVEHPQIYTKYIRIEFLSHYGNEYYCPVSLLRVHGTRMLDSWKEQSHDDDVEQIEGTRPQEALIDSNQTDTQADAAPSNTTENNNPYTSVVEMGLSPWQPVFYYNFSEETCVLWSPTTEDPTPVSVGADHNHSAPAGHRENVTVPSPQATVPSEAGRSPGSASGPAAAAQQVASQSQQTSIPSAGSSAQPQKVAHVSGDGSTSNTQSSKHSTARTDGSSDGSSSRSSGTTTASSVTASRNKTASSSASSASPTVQESFFKTVTKRLQLLESNTSLSLQYIEEQSRFLQEALLKMEKKQAGRVDSFLDNLNKTVLAELRTIRTQYDQIWQSTVIALETQREQSQREIVALSGRVAVLADEVVFQKRMAILQSVLLLSCLVMVIFSRSGSPSHFNSFSHHFRSDSMSASPPPGSFNSPSSPPVSGSTPHIHNGHHPRAYRGDKILPMTPTSQTSREGTPMIHVEGVQVPFFGDSSPSPPSQQQVKRRRSRVVSETAEEGIEECDETELSPGVQSTGSSVRDNRSYVSQTETAAVVHDEQEPLMRPLAKSRSSSSQLGSVRKPLPALPEDPS
ncbi:UNC-like C-terminal-domain-containing protein [Podospora aff. communis PSN243]|uniref:UNC-like C-terminal-domain-containing protein n=1 Tax=Podospora aff. communis PSN243 TaxID=3040156 RepID=A0AAV9GKV2_9PEZI|nr:UNC-like C-terminal-domain-containing protein [Podospora aff. communis PSN243]